MDEMHNTKSNAIELILFDFDETLCMTEEACFYLENKTALQMGLPPVDRDFHKKTWGKQFREVIPERFPGADVDTFIKNSIVNSEKYIADGRLDSIGQDRIRVLNNLIGMGINVGILTSRTKGEVEHLLDPNHIVSQKFERIYHLDVLDYVKPDPRVFKKPLSEFNCKPENAVYVGDAVTDAIAANGAGLRFIAYIESDIRNEDMFKKVNVDTFAYSFEEILEWVIKQ